MDRCFFCRSVVDHGGIQPFSTGRGPYRLGLVFDQLYCFFFQTPPPERTGQFPGGHPDHDDYQCDPGVSPGLYPGIPGPAQVAANRADHGNFAILDLLLIISGL